jgi:hypothetical protein
MLKATQLATVKTPTTPRLYMLIPICTSAAYGRRRVQIHPHPSG